MKKRSRRIVDHFKARAKPDPTRRLPKKRPMMSSTIRAIFRKTRSSVYGCASVRDQRQTSVDVALGSAHLRIGYGRAAAILDAMVREGYIGEMDGSSRARPILEKAYEFL